MSLWFRTVNSLGGTSWSIPNCIPTLYGVYFSTQSKPTSSSTHKNASVLLLNDNLNHQHIVHFLCNVHNTNFLNQGGYLKVDDSNLKVRKYKKGGWIVLAFSSFSPTEVTDQKQLGYIFWSDVEILDAADKTERERVKEERHKQLYRFLPQTGSSHVPLALPRRVHYNVISDYKCSLLNLARDFKCSNTTARDFLCSWTQSRDFYAQKQK